MLPMRRKWSPTNFGWLIVICGIAVASGAQAQSENNAAKCFQRALNNLGYEAGAADGIIGRGTVNAFVEFRQDHTNAPGEVALSDASMISWCLFLAREFELDEQTELWAGELAESARVTATVEIDPEADFRILIGGVTGQKIIDVEPVETEYEGRTVRVVAFPYIETTDASHICIILAQGWLATNVAGNPTRQFCWTANFPFIIEGHATFRVGFEVHEGEFEQ
jgi:hypothetical protein